MEEALELAWKHTWCRAFPTLAPVLFSNVDVSTQLLAFDEIFASSDDRSQPTTVVDERSTPPPNHSSNNLGYGEITPETVFLVMEWIQRNAYDDGETAKVTVDLGSDNGRVLFATSLAHPFHTLRGIEILPKLHQEALANLQLWKQRSSCIDRQQNPRFEFICADFFHHPNLVTDADLVWVHATVFDVELMEKVQQICEACSRETFFVMVTKPLKCLHGIVTCATLQLEMDWGQATVYIQGKEHSRDRKQIS